MENATAAFCWYFLLTPETGFCTIHSMPPVLGGRWSMVDLEGSSRPDLPRSQVLRAGSERRRTGRREAKNKGQMTEDGLCPKQGIIARRDAKTLRHPAYRCPVTVARLVSWDVWRQAWRAAQPFHARRFRRPSPPGPLVQTNPIPGGAGWDGAAGTRDEGQMCETNPISRLRISDCGLGTDLRRDACSVACHLGLARDDHAKRTQFGRSHAKGKCFAEKGLW